MAQVMACNEKKLMRWTLSMILTSHILFFYTSYSPYTANLGGKEERDLKRKKG